MLQDNKRLMGHASTLREQLAELQSDAIFHKTSGTTNLRSSITTSDTGAAAAAARPAWKSVVRIKSPNSGTVTPTRMSASNLFANKKEEDKERAASALKAALSLRASRG